MGIFPKQFGKNLVILLGKDLEILQVVSRYYLEKTKQLIGN